MTVDERDNLCLALTLLAVALPSAYLAWTWRWPSHLASYGRSVAWWLAACLPFAMAIGYFHAAWPYGEDNRPSFPQHPFRWDRLAREVYIGFGLACGLGILTRFCFGLSRVDSRPPQDNNIEEG